MRSGARRWGVSAIATFVAIAIACPGTTFAQPIAIGQLARINTFTTNNQLRPHLARAVDDRFLVSWTSGFQLDPALSEDGDDNGVFARFYDALGGALGQPFQVNTNTVNDQSVPTAAISSTGNSLIVWQSREQDGDDFGIFAQLYDSVGAPIGGEFQVNEYTTGRQTSQTVAVASDGSFVVVWQSGSTSFGNGFDGDASGISARRYDGSSGTALSAEYLVNTFTSGSQFHPTVAPTGGNFIVVWTDSGRGPTTIYARFLDSIGLPTGSEFQVSLASSGLRSLPSTVGEPTGGFLAAWTDQSGLDGSLDGVFARRMDSAGTPTGGDILVNSSTAGVQNLVSVVRDQATSTFLVTWREFDATGDRFFTQRVDDSGALVGTAFQIVASNGRAAFDLAVSPDTLGGLAVVHQLEDSFDGDRDIYLERFACDAAGADGDGDGLSDLCDPCPGLSSEQDSDADCIDDSIDNCAAASNADQADDDVDLVGNACDQCSGEDDSINVDSDILPDCIDPCVRMGGFSEMGEKSKLRFKFINTNNTFGDDKFFLRGDAVLPGGTVFDDIDPLTVPVRIQTIRSDAFIVFERALEAQALNTTKVGWRQNGRKSKWQFLDRSGNPPQGIVQVLIGDRGKKQPGQIRIRVKGKIGAYNTPLSSPPLQTALTVIDGSISQCAETAFTSVDCRFGALDSTVTCRR